MKIFWILLFVMIPQIGFACPPAANIDQMSDEEKIKWNEANPCPMTHDVNIYNAVRKECLEKSNNDRKAKEICNHEASMKSDILPNSTR